MRALAIAALLLGASAHADDTRWRLATVAPSGSLPAQSVQAFGRDVEQRTNGRVNLKWYFDAIAGDEMEMMARLDRGQLDGVGSAGLLCERKMPSLRVLRFPGLFQNRAEIAFVINRLRPVLEAEAAERGLTLLAHGITGSDMAFLRRPLHTMAELRALTLWRWDADDVGIALVEDMGMRVVRAPIYDAGRAFDSHRVDGFWAVPVGALIFQWDLQAPYMLDLHGGYLIACVLVKSHLLDAVAPDDRRHVVAAGARLSDSFAAATRKVDEGLLHGGFQHQGVQVIEPDAAFRAQYLAAATATRERIGAKIVPQALIDRVLSLLSDYRAEHGAK